MPAFPIYRHSGEPWSCRRDTVAVRPGVLLSDASKESLQFAQFASKSFPLSV